jgi:hypothetical protein
MKRLILLVALILGVVSVAYAADSSATGTQTATITAGATISISVPALSNGGAYTITAPLTYPADETAFADPQAIMATSNAFAGTDGEEVITCSVTPDPALVYNFYFTIDGATPIGTLLASLKQASASVTLSIVAADIIQVDGSMSQPNGTAGSHHSIVIHKTGIVPVMVPTPFILTWTAHTNP